MIKTRWRLEFPGEKRPNPAEDKETLFKCVPTRINFSKYDEISVKVSVNVVPGNMLIFESHFKELSWGNIQRADYVKPTLMEKNDIPVIHAGRDRIW